MPRKSQAGRRGRPPIHDPSLIARLVAEREATGASWATLAARTGIPAGTLSSFARRGDAGRGRSPFVEVVAGDVDDDSTTRCVGSAPPFTLITAFAGVHREVVVPAGFDARELRRLLQVLES